MDAQTACGTRILVIDDDTALRQLIGEVLGSEGYTVVAPDPLEAVETASAAPFDLILLDVLMPNIDGRHLCRRLRVHPATKAIPIVFVTGVPEFLLAPFHAHSGAWGYLQKPFTLDELFAAVSAQL